MKKRFPGHYRPSEQEFAELWLECLFIPDTNILLHLFRYGEKTRAQVLDTLGRLKPRVWIPYRVGLEFQRRWRDVDRHNRDAYEGLEKAIIDQGHQMESLFDQYTQHQTIDVKEEKLAIKEFISKLCERLKKNKANHPAAKDAEQIFYKISELIGDAVGERPTPKKIEELVKEGQRRYDNNIPPGYRDAKTKDGTDKYGDFLIWNELLEKAKSIQKPIVVVTDDVKDDWWQAFHGAKLGPRPELIEEMLDYSGQKFYLYTLSQFLNYASAFLKRTVDKSAIDEIKSDEQQQRQVAKRVRHHLIPRAYARHIINSLNERQVQLRLRRHQIDLELSAISDEPTAVQIEKVQKLLAERHTLTERIITNSRKIQLHKQNANRTRMVSLNESRSAAENLLRDIMIHQSTREVEPDSSDESEDLPLLPPEGASEEE